MRIINIIKKFFPKKHGNDLIHTIAKKIIPRHCKNIIKLLILAVKEIVAKKNYRYLYKKYKEYSMIPEIVFYDNLEIVKKFSNIEGCLVECGVWRGGMIAAIAEMLGNKRTYYLFDSFEGLPESKEIDGVDAMKWQKDTTSPIYFNNCATEMKFSVEAMRLSGVNQYEIVKGWFEKTLPNFRPSQPIAILRLDADWYDSTVQCLYNLYPFVTKGGVIIVDDYYTWDGCRKAVHDFLSKNKLADKIFSSEHGVCYIVKN